MVSLTTLILIYVLVTLIGLDTIILLLKNFYNHLLTLTTNVPTLPAT